MLYTTIEKIMKKFNEYNLKLLSHYKVENDGYCFIFNEMVIFFDNSNKSLSVAFHVNQRPEDVAFNMLMLKEINIIKKIYIMESFTYNNDDEYISGEEAFKFLNNSLYEQLFHEIVKFQMYDDILKTTKGYDC